MTRLRIPLQRMPARSKRLDQVLDLGIKAAMVLGLLWVLVAFAKGMRR